MVKYSDVIERSTRLLLFNLIITILLHLSCSNIQNNEKIYIVIISSISFMFIDTYYPRINID